MVQPGMEEIFSISDVAGFNAAALQVFRYQSANCAVYSKFIKGLKIEPATINTVENIPFLPIEFFKTHPVISSKKPAEITFTSSGTTGMITSRHHVVDVSCYRESFRRAFKIFYGDIKNYCVLALLPSYLERDGSSLIYMAEDMIEQSGNGDSGFFLYDHELLYNQLTKQQRSNTPVILIGVTFALLDFIESYRLDFPQIIVMETGGMKGRRKEMIREELHDALRGGFGVNAIHSEYGMTELLSQAYSKGDGIFECPPWMKVLTRDVNDPLSYTTNHKTGGINVIDLANVHSCAFIATQDLGTVAADGSFEVLGRFDNSDIRGCNLLLG